MHPEHVTEVEIDAYIDGELDLSHQLAVEDYLARQPETAARVMADLRACTALRLLHEPQGDPPPALLHAAERLRQRLDSAGRAWRWRPSMSRLATAMAGMGVLALIVMLDRRISAPPAYVADAVMAYQTGLLRAAMPSQLESPVLDPGEILRSTHIRVPRLPHGWQVTDVQIFPSDEGPALQIMIRTPEQKHISIFAIRAPSAAPVSPVAVRHGATSVAFWRNHDMSYALTGVEAPDALDVAAEDLAAERPS